jgi:hypothetical protein
MPGEEAMFLRWFLRAFRDLWWLHGFGTESYLPGTAAGAEGHAMRTYHPNRCPCGAIRTDKVGYHRLYHHECWYHGTSTCSHPTCKWITLGIKSIETHLKRWGAFYDWERSHENQELDDDRKKPQGI